jgi:hypothetical protein
LPLDDTVGVFHFYEAPERRNMANPTKNILLFIEKLLESSSDVEELQAYYEVLTKAIDQFTENYMMRDALSSNKLRARIKAKIFVLDYIYDGKSKRIIQLPFVWVKPFCSQLKQTCFINDIEYNFDLNGLIEKKAYIKFSGKRKKSKKGKK